ncbi:CheR family methyltransferase [Palleronia pelagia]|uniref:Chemotaxis protein methyltransferase n=1 Tax=Palleronia pelagia TaxID=387096 RepID=A0A1H8AY41_9RHOB|nr:protein-glutamate O-methyltransferase [Palleronia pelagia]SEM75670.1 chemotaxis protein methyltransferase CheR [Palleronia pelagia]
MTGTDLLRLDLSEDAFEKIAAILAERTGIRLEPGTQRLVVSRLSRHLRRLGLNNFEAFLDHVLGPNGTDDLAAMIDALTTNTTRFFRESGHFRILEDQIMPRLAEKARAGGRVRIWSAACSSGEEPYSIAAVVEKCMPDVSQFNFRILATDIDSKVLKAAEEGRYASAARRDAGPDFAARLFEKATGADDTLRVRAALRNLVTVRYLNFMDPWPVSGPFDVIFCRNVAIYMEPDTQMRIWSGLEQVLDRDGVLFIGHSERIGPPLSDRLELFGPTSFRRPGAAISS